MLTLLELREHMTIYFSCLLNYRVRQKDLPIDVFLSIYSVLKNDELIILGTHVPHLYLSSCAQHFFEKATFTQI